jgi:hypothetical protein
VAKQKNQHYVPRCHFKPFSLGGEGRAINLFNVTKTLPIPNAPVRGQCSKDYFHGRDGLEGGLAKIETVYGTVVHPLVEHDSLSPEGLSFLASFAFLQFHRTDTAIRRKRLANLDMQDAVYYVAEDQCPAIDLSDRTLIHESIELFDANRHYVDDLKCCLVRNRTQRDFVTSDDPAVITNKFYMQRLNRSDFGIASSGAMMVLPLTPRYLFLAYDGGVYTIPDKRNDCVDLTNVGDVLALNELQYLKASENIYFAQWAERTQISADFEKVRASRPESWNVIRMAVRVDGDATLFREATREQARNARHSLLHLQAIFPRPSAWLSKLKHRNPPRTFFNGSGVGHVRKREFLHG